MLLLAVSIAAGFLFKAVRMWMGTVNPVTEALPERAPDFPHLGYADRMIYAPGDSVILHLGGRSDTCPAAFGRYGMGGGETVLARFRLAGIKPQATLPDAVAKGARWPPTAGFALPKDLRSGYYFLRLGDREEDFRIPILVRDSRRPAPLAVFANVSTWTAYNEWGGSSLYRNLPSGRLPHLVSHFRPNLAFSGRSPKHDIRLEAHIFNWLDSLYGCRLYADPELEGGYQAFSGHSVMVLPYHPEYFSEGMYATLRNLVFRDARSLLYLGGNGIYHKSRWRDGGIMECRKDMSLFEGTWSPGGLWKWSLHPEQTLLGVRYSGAGYASLAPYQALSSSHWLWKGAGIGEGERFGGAGMDGRPLSGPETDKVAWLSPPGAVRLARGLNPRTGRDLVYPDPRAEWNGEGGADIVFFPSGDSSGVLSTGSMRSGAGLGADAAMTHLVKAFLARYVPSGFARISDDGVDQAGMRPRVLQ